MSPAPRPRKTKWQLGRAYCVEFLDHVEDGGDAELFRVWGRCVRVTDDVVVLASWDYADPSSIPSPDHWEDDTNRKTFSIVLSAIRSCHLLPK